MSHASEIIRCSSQFCPIFRKAARQIVAGLLACSAVCWGAVTPVQAQDSSSSIRPFTESIPMGALAGLYVGTTVFHQNGKDVRGYLRIYPDGTTVSVNSGWTAEEVGHWLRRGGPEPTLTGQLRLSGAFFEVTTSDYLVSIHYHGIFRGNSLLLDCESTYQNTTLTNEVYRYLPGL